MTKQFPKFHSHNGVVCFNCGTKLSGEWVDSSGFIYGRYRQMCHSCKMYTFYDCAEPVGQLEAFKEHADTAFNALCGG